MPVTAAMVANVLTAAKTTFPTAVVTVHYGDEFRHSLSAIRSESPEADDDSGLSGNIPGLRGTLRFTLSDAGDWVPPTDGKKILLEDSTGAEIGTFTVLAHSDAPTGTVRKLFYGEETA